MQWVCLLTYASMLFPGTTTITSRLHEGEETSTVDIFKLVVPFCAFGGWRVCLVLDVYKPVDTYIYVLM